MQTTPYAPLVAIDNNVPDEQKMYRFASVWVVLTRNPETAGRLLEAGMESYVIDPEDRIRVWTDDYSNIISLINWR